MTASRVPVGLVFKVQRHSVHDGPGIRTILFLKGCPLACLWCSNPESQSATPELLRDMEKCIACGACAEACQLGAVRAREVDGRLGLVEDPRACKVCGDCAEVCYAGARTVAGRAMAVDEAVDTVLRDRPFYERSGGGVTLSGGEPLAQVEFAAAVLAGCKAAGVHTAMETCGYAPDSDLRRVLPLVDLFLFDLKHLSAEKHRAWTGVDNALILSGLRRLVDAGAAVIVRVPVIPGFNDSEEEIDAVARHAAELGIGEIHLLPYHRYGEHKYRFLGRPYRLSGLAAPDDHRMRRLSEVAAAAGLTVHVGG